MLRRRFSELPEQRGRAEGTPISQKFSGAHVCPLTLFPHPPGICIPVLRVPPKQGKRVERGGSEAGGRLPGRAEGSAAFGWESARCVIWKDRRSRRAARGRGGSDVTSSASTTKNPQRNCANPRFLGCVNAFIRTWVAPEFPPGSSAGSGSAGDAGAAGSAGRALTSPLG